MFHLHEEKYCVLVFFWNYPVGDENVIERLKKVIFLKLFLHTLLFWVAFFGKACTCVVRNSLKLRSVFLPLAYIFRVPSLASHLY